MPLAIFAILFTTFLFSVRIQSLPVTSSGSSTTTIVDESQVNPNNADSLTGADNNYHNHHHPSLKHHSHPHVHSPPGNTGYGSPPKYSTPLSFPLTISHGRATFYDTNPLLLGTDLGACELPNHLISNDHIVALNAPMWRGSGLCGMCIKIKRAGGQWFSSDGLDGGGEWDGGNIGTVSSGNAGNGGGPDGSVGRRRRRGVALEEDRGGYYGGQGSVYDGVEVYAVVADECPECPPGALDLSPTLFGKLAPLDEGVIPITWTEVPCSNTAITPPSMAVRWSGDSSEYWFAMQVYNSAYVVDSVEARPVGASMQSNAILTDTNGWTTLSRASNNFFTGHNMGQGPFEFRVKTRNGLVAVTGDSHLRMDSNAVQIQNWKLM
ncbi:hypothetical protein HDU76_004543 [Blyttiomyces sp. JEL0837]|nr:hypothetical protein HDU76_004543 [Blyttiomyces sp. JEL0837]